ncbi:MAG: rplY [Candidatus Saccharibacteria bacterium]|jgi:large subunit ribosomal protein L25|nr:rplY [Candidatus Saccharibacteria bacterium]
MNDITLNLEERTAEGKRVHQLRHDGFVPSVVYGGKAAPISTQSQAVETLKAVKAAGKHSPVHLTISGKKQLAIIKTIDFDPVKHTLRHVAFHAINQNEKIVTEVPIVLIGEGESVAEKAGLIILQAIEKMEIRALPNNLPESLEISIIDLATADDKLTIGDIKLPKGVEFADVEQDTDLVIANVYEPSALQAANDAAGGEAEDESSVESEKGTDTTAASDDAAKADAK